MNLRLLANLHLALSEWATPIKDTHEEMQRKISLYVKQLRQNVKDSAAESTETLPSEEAADNTKPQS